MSWIGNAGGVGAIDEEVSWSHGSASSAELYPPACGIHRQKPERFRSAESEREALARQHVAALQEKLAAVEAHTEQMRRQLKEERSRALTDVLTGLPNREAWEERLAQEFERWRRYQQPVAWRLWISIISKRSMTTTATWQVTRPFG